MAERLNRLDKWQPIAERTEVDTPWLRVKNVTYQLPSGIVGDFHVVEKPSLALAIPLLDNKTYLFQAYERGVDQVGYKFPGGRREEGEDAATAAARELEEEVGIKAKRLVHLGTSHVDPPLMTTKADFFVCDDFEKSTRKKVDDPTELMEGEWLDISEVGERIATNEIKSALVIVGFTLLSNYLFKQKN